MPINNDPTRHVILHEDRASPASALARIAHHLLTSGEENSVFLQAKIVTARFYAEHVLPEAGPWRDEITTGAASTWALEEALFQPARALWAWLTRHPGDGVPRKGKAPPV